MHLIQWKTFKKYGLFTKLKLQTLEPDHAMLLRAFMGSTTQKHRLWVFETIRKAIMARGCGPWEVDALERLSQRAFMKVTRRYWWDARVTGDPCKCWKCS